MSQAAYDELSRCIVQLLLKEPFFGHLLGSVTRSVSDAETPTAAVGLRGPRPALIINPTFFMKTLRKGVERVAVVKHEALHLLFKHLLRVDWKKQDPLIFNLAADLVVNQFIKNPWKLPEGAIVLETFADLNLLPDQSVEWYYERLKKCDEGKPGSSKSKDLITGMRGAKCWHSDHGGWGKTDGDGSGKGSGFGEAAETELDRIVVQARDRAGARGWGALPGPLRDLITAILSRRAPKVDWRRALRLFSSSARRTKVKSTVMRKSKRYPENPGIKIKRYQHMAVVIDTSGSISDHDLSAFFAEIQGIWKGGAEVTVIECDAAVHRAWDYRGRLPLSVGGRGGTSFDPAFQWLRDYRGSAPFDGCIYLTDGVAPEPKVRPPCKLIWVILPGGTLGPHLKWGRAVQLPPV